MEKMTWIEVKAKLEPWPEDTSPVIELFLQSGIENTIETKPWISGCLPLVPGASDTAYGLASALKEAGAVETQVLEFEEQNWDEVWKQYFKPRRIGERFVVTPSWEPYEPLPDDLVITLDPGQAFGTGDHPTTRLCLELLSLVPVEGLDVADVGCGSGILAVGAKLLGAAKVYASDIDATAVSVARENADRNNVSIEFFVGGGFDPVVHGEDGAPGDWGEDELILTDADRGTIPSELPAAARQFEVVLSNIISMILIRLSPEAYAAVKPGGYWIVSGIIEQNWPDVQSAAEAVGFTLVEMRQEDDWVGACFRK